MHRCEAIYTLAPEKMSGCIMILDGTFDYLRFQRMQRQAPMNNVSPNSLNLTI